MSFTVKSGYQMSLSQLQALFHLKIKKYLKQKLNYLMSSGSVPFIVVEQTTFSRWGFRAGRPLLLSSDTIEKQGPAHRWGILINRESVTCLTFVNNLSRSWNTSAAAAICNKSSAEARPLLRIQTLLYESANIWPKISLRSPNVNFSFLFQ